jgi:hypothetical protein
MLLLGFAEVPHSFRKLLGHAINARLLKSSGLVKGHDFSRAENTANKRGFSP